MTRKRRNTKHFEDLFIDYAITKTELAEVINAARDSVVRWSKLAFYLVPSFREAYPKTSDGGYDIESPLNPYQAWVVVRVAREFAKLKNADRVRLSIKKQPNNFSVYTYRQAQKELTKLAA